MSRQDDIAAAEIAALVGGHMRSLDTKMIQKSSTGAGVEVDPRQFLTRSSPKKRSATNSSAVPRDMIVEQPKSRPAGSEVVGTQDVNINDLVIPVDGMDEKMRDAIQAYSSPSNNPQQPQTQQPQPQTQQPQPQPQPQPQQPQQPQPQNVVLQILESLEQINEKLDIILKRGKIQPRYKNRNKK